MKPAPNIEPCGKRDGNWRRMDGRPLCRNRAGSPPVFWELRHALRQIGEQRYHHRHPFHLLMHDGKLSRGQLQAWALNRYYYQSVIPIKDAIIISRSKDPLFRRAWRKRIVDHDGDATSEGGIKRWLKLAEATGLDGNRVISG